MAHHKLPAGTDVAEMALFDVDAVPKSRLPDRATIDALIAQERLISFPTGADGGYLLDLYINEAVPDHIRQHCEADDQLTGHFATSNGRIAFGGAESAFMDYRPNANIRSDASVDPGRYAYTAYRTEFPEALVHDATRVERNRQEWWARRMPMFAVLLAIVLTTALLALRHPAWAALAVLLCVAAFRWFRSRPMYWDVVARQDQAQLAFPSIVIEMRSISR